MSRYGNCERCGKYCVTSRHHPLPRRHYGRGQQNSWTVKLCEGCHLKADNITINIDKKVLDEMKTRFRRAFQEFMEGA
jgi:hypothetical protein